MLLKIRATNSYVRGKSAHLREKAYNDRRERALYNERHGTDEFYCRPPSLAGRVGLHELL